jgi:dihydropteroate synthase
MSVQLVGILNVTPDSFSDGGLFFDSKKALAQAQKLFDYGAVILDIGAEATNPKVEPISATEEWERLKNVLPELIQKFPGRLSLDTYHPETAERVLKLGPIIINDVTTFKNPKLIEVVARHKAICIVSHLPLAASSIKDAHANFHIDDAAQVKNELLQQRQALIDAGLPAANIILDPGIGFGKTMRLNWELLEFARLVPDAIVMLGASRKRFLGTNPHTGIPLPNSEELRADPKSSLEAAQIAARAGAKYVRVHDVASHAQFLASQNLL